MILKKWLKFLRPHHEVTGAHNDSELAKREAEEELGNALSLAKASQDVVSDLDAIIYRNGFSVALGHAFARKGTA